MRVSLRARFFLAIALVTAVLTGAFAFGFWQSIELLEQELLDHTLARELQSFAEAYAQEPRVRPPEGVDLRAFVVRREDAGSIPAEFLALGPGLHEDVVIGEREYMVGRKDVGGDRLFLALDIEPVEALEEQVTALALLSLVSGLVFAGLAASVLGRVVMQPVTRLSQLVGALAPGQRGVRLVERFGDREIGVIASALDRYLRRLDGYIERERAFTEDASHELRTPLATILTAAQLALAEPDLPEPQRLRLQRIERAAQDMHALIESLLALAREDGTTAAADCEFDRLLREVAETLGDTARAHGARIEIDAAPVQRRAIRALVRSVFANLLLNAIQHGGPGPVRAVLTGTALTVEDRGPGITAAVRERLFERGERGPASGGAGLGLHLVRRACERLGWRIDLESGGTGTRATVHFGGT